MRQIAQMKDLLTITDSGHDFDVYVTANGQNVTVISSSQIRHEFEYQYYEWSMFTRGEALSENYGYLVLCFSDYCKEMQMSFNRIYEALTADYDPTSNYARHSKESHKNTRTIGYGKSVTTDYGDDGLTTTTNYGHEVLNKTTTFDNTATLRDANKTIYQNGSGNGDTNTITGEVSNTASGTDTITDTGLQNDNQRDETGLWRNTASENIETEIGMRIRENFLDIVMDGFVKRYLFLLA